MPAPAPTQQPVPAVESSGHSGNVYVVNPNTGVSEERTPEEAAHLVYSAGWTPVSRDDAVKIDSSGILREMATPQESIIQGLGRGLSGGISDILPRGEAERRERDAIDQAFPWLTPSAELAGFLAPVGVAPALSAGGEALSGLVRGGAEGFLPRVVSRATGVAAEGSVYGGINAAREAQIEDTPLTAQKLLSGAFGGAAIGATLGGGLGALEGAGAGAKSLLRRFAGDTSAARDELARAGLHDADVKAILERQGVPAAPGALEEFQARLYNDPNITPEFLASIKASPGIRDDVFGAAHPARAAAEADFAKALDELHQAQDEALAGWSGRLKREQVGNWIGPDAAYTTDAKLFLDHMGGLPIEQRAQEVEKIISAVKSAGSKDWEGFQDLMNTMGVGNEEQLTHNLRRALTFGDKNVVNSLLENRLFNDEGVARFLERSKVPTGEMEVNVRAFDEGDMRPESMEYVRRNLDHLEPPRIEQYPGANAVVADGRHRMQAAFERGAREMRVNFVRFDEAGNEVSSSVRNVRLVSSAENPGFRNAVRELRARPLPSWKQASLDLLDSFGSKVGGLQLEPKGYVGEGAGGKIKELSGLIAGARDKVLAGDRANAFAELDYVKKRLGSFRGEGYLKVGEGPEALAQGMHEEARRFLENPEHWGEKAAGAQREMNALLHQRLARNDDFYKAFYSGSGAPDVRNPWTEGVVADPKKIQSMMDKLVDPTNSRELALFKKHIAETADMADAMKRFYALDQKGAAIVGRTGDAVKRAQDSMDKALHANLRINQGEALRKGTGIGQGGIGLAGMIGGMLFGRVGAIAGAGARTAFDMATNPGKSLYYRALIERMLGSHSERIGAAVGQFAERGARAVSTVAQASGRAVGAIESIGYNTEENQRVYRDTMQDLVKMASSRDAVVAALGEMYGPGLVHVPAATMHMADALLRASAFLLAAAPVKPEPGLFEDEIGIVSDSEMTDWAKQVTAALDPTSILHMATSGTLTPEAVKAAEVSAPELVNSLRQDVMRYVTTVGPEKIAPAKQIGISVLFGVPMGQRLAPGSIALSQKFYMPSKPPSAAQQEAFSETGLTSDYSKTTMSQSDRLESPEVPR